MRGFDDTPWRKKLMDEDPRVRKNAELYRRLVEKGIVKRRPHRHGALVHSPWVKDFRRGASWSRAEERYMFKLVKIGVEKHHLSKKQLAARSVWQYVARKLGRPVGSVYERFVLLSALRRP